MSLWPPQTWNGVGNTEAGVAPFTGPSARRRRTGPGTGTATSLVGEESGLTGPS